MKKYTVIEPFKGRRSKSRWLREYMKKRGTGFGKRPGRRQILKRKCKGYMDEIGEAKGLGNCRIYFQNIGTLPIGKDRYEVEEAADILQRAEVDVVVLTEVNKN